MNYLDYREALGIGFDDEVKMDHFQTQCLNLLKSRENFEYSVDDYVDFCNAVSATYNYEFGSLYDAICILEGFEGKYFLFAMIAFANTFNHYEDMQEFFKEEIIKYLNNSKLFHRIITDEDGIFVLPEGAKELDDNLVSETYEWLYEYPETRKEMSAALKAYSEATPETAYKVADYFRTTLERFFQNYFCAADRSLENFKDDLGTHLKNNGVPSEIRNIMIKNFELYTKYMNNYAKHTNKAKVNVLEFIMYQTGLTIRTIITLGKEE